MSLFLSSQVPDPLPKFVEDTKKKTKPTPPREITVHGVTTLVGGKEGKTIYKINLEHPKVREWTDSGQSWEYKLEQEGFGTVNVILG